MRAPMSIGESDLVSCSSIYTELIEVSAETLWVRQRSIKRELNLSVMIT